MPNWKRVIVSGSSAHLNNITASGNITIGDGNYIDTDSNTTYNIYIGDKSTADEYGSVWIKSGLNGESGLRVYPRDEAGSPVTYAAFGYDSNSNYTQIGNASNTEILKLDTSGNTTFAGNISGSSTSTGSFGSVHTAGNVYLGDGTSDSKLIRIEAAGGEDASIRLMEGETDTYGFSLFMDGGGNQFSIRGHDASAGGTAHLTMERDTGAATFAGDVDITRASNAVMTIKATASGTGARLKLKSANNDATYIAYYDNDDTTLAQIYSYGSSYGTTALRKSLEFKTGGSTTALTLDGSQNATFGGNVSGSSTSTGSFGHLVIAKDAHIGEDVLADGDVVAYNSSDIRLKDNIQVIQGSLDKIDGINGYEFDWNEKSPGWAKERGHDVGVIAQEVQKVLPEVVVERKSGYLGVDYKRLIPLLVESIKELKQEVENLKKKVN